MDPKLILQLVQLADQLDAKGLSKEADMVDDLITEAPQTHPEAGMDMLSFNLISKLLEKISPEKLIEKIKSMSS